MTSEQMLVRVRKLLDELEEGFWSDAEIFEALTEGQTAVVNYALSGFRKNGGAIPPVLIPYISKLEGIVAFETQYVPFPLDFGALISLKFASDSVNASDRQLAVDRKTLAGGDRLSRNCLFASSKSNPFYQQYGDRMIFEDTVLDLGSYEMVYFSKPRALDMTVNSYLPEHTHPSLVEFAYSSLIRKDGRIEEAKIQYNAFLQGLEFL